MLCLSISDVNWTSGVFSLSESVNEECVSTVDGSLGDICMLCSGEKVYVCGL